MRVRNLELRFDSSSHLTNRGFIWPLSGKGCDEWHNKSWYLILPLIGWFVLYKIEYTRQGAEHLYAFGPDGWEGKDWSIWGCDICKEIKEI